ncbi:zinc finger protein 436-like [Centruroides vittatus]|uniref:zinc finger protein 436-like n=1 Tax=Centruroides vittatus TaxID=120091 RepID=UPI00350F4D8F
MAKNFVQKSALDNHRKIHLKVKPHICTRCNRSFSDPSTLKKHERTHTREKPYKCTRCNRGFSQSGNMLRHMRRVCLNVQTDMNQKSCHCCKTTFKRYEKTQQSSKEGQN